MSIKINHATATVQETVPKLNPEDYNLLRMFVDQLHDMQLVKARVRNATQHDISANWQKKTIEANKRLHIMMGKPQVIKK